MMWFNRKDASLLLRLPKEVLLCLDQLENPSADTTYTLHSPMELLEVLITLPLRKQ
jgi:hypothetical protein